MCLIVRDMESISDTSRFRQTRRDKRKWDLVVSSDSIRLIGDRLGVDDIIPELLIELLPTGEGEHAREEGNISRDKLSDHDRLAIRAEVCLIESIPIVTELFVRSPSSDTIEGESVIHER